jgi:hypothetical protein
MFAAALRWETIEKDASGVPIIKCNVELFTVASVRPPPPHSHT